MESIRSTFARGKQIELLWLGRNPGNRAEPEAVKEEAAAQLVEKDLVEADRPAGKEKEKIFLG